MYSVKQKQRMSCLQVQNTKHVTRPTTKNLLFVGPLLTTLTVIPYDVIRKSEKNNPSIFPHLLTISSFHISL